MSERKIQDRGISDVASGILIVALVLALAVVVYVLIAGSADPKYLQKTVYIAGESSIIPLGTGGDHILTFLPRAGDDFALIGQAQGKGTPVTLRIISPDGRNITPDTSSLKGSLYGKILYIFQKSTSNACEYVVSESRPDQGVPVMTNGVWRIQLIDEKVHVLAASYASPFDKGTTSLPVTVLLGTGTGGISYRADCSVSPGTCTGTCPAISNLSPCNMSYASFTGSNSLTFPDDPTLKYTGDMSIAVSIRPAATGDPANSGNWHQIIGKGVTVGVDNENDNYQFFQMGDRLYFEWNDAVTGIHYHAMTPPGIVQAGQWNNLNVVVQNGQLAIYQNGVSQPLTFYQSNVPGVNPIPPPPVHLQNNNNAVTIGKQNGSPGNEFYFKGDIGGISLYNRGLSAAEIAALACHG